MQGLGVGPRYSTRDHWIQESIKGIFNSGLFWAVESAEKKNPNCHYKYATFDVSFHSQKYIFKKYIFSAVTKKLPSIKVRFF